MVDPGADPIRERAASPPAGPSPSLAGPSSSASLDDEKRAVRSRLRARRRALTDRPERSARIVARLIGLDPVVGAERLLVYRHVPGEVETERLVDWAVAGCRDVLTPEDDVDPAWPDVVIAPGVAFTRRGERLGQGGGWFDRFLLGRRPDAVVIGIAFECQIVGAVPVAEHDLPVDCVVTEDGAWWRA